MRFLMLILPRGYERAEPGAMPDADAVEAMMAYNRELEEAGVLLALDGLHPPSMGARVSFRSGKPEVILAPFPGVEEVVGGYWMIDVPSREDAIAWASRCPASADETIEIRQVQELEEFPADVRAVASDFPALQHRPERTRPA